MIIIFLDSSLRQVGAAMSSYLPPHHIHIYYMHISLAIDNETRYVTAVEPKYVQPLNSDPVKFSSAKIHARMYSQTLAQGNGMNEIKQRNRRRRYEEKLARKKRSPDGVSHPNQNTIIINLILMYFIRYGKGIMKFN